MFVDNSTITLNSETNYCAGGKGGNGGQGSSSSGGFNGNGGNGGNGGNFYVNIQSSTIDLKSLPLHSNPGDGGAGATIYAPTPGRAGTQGSSGSRTGVIFNNIIYNNPTIDYSDFETYIDPVNERNILDGQMTAGNYWMGISNDMYYNIRNTSLPKHLFGYIPLDEQKYQVFLGITSINGDIYPLYDGRNLPDVSYIPPPTLSLIESGMTVESDSLYTPVKRISLSQGEQIIETEFISNSELLVVTTHGVYNIDVSDYRITNLGGTRGAVKTCKIYSGYVTTWDDAGDLTIWNTTTPEQPGTKVLMGFTQYNIQEVTNNNNYMAYAALESATDTTPTIFSFSTDGAYKGTAANIAAYKEGTMEISSTNVLGMIRSVTGNTNFPRYNAETMAAYAAITVPAAPSDLHNIMNTDTFIVSTTGSTYMYGYDSAGRQTFSAISALSTPTSHVSGSNARNIIASSNNVIYVIDSAGATIGQFASGTAVNDLEIARTSGLYFVAGGDDALFYVFSKFQSSDWMLSQGTQMIDAISDVGIAPSGIYLTCRVNGVEYLWVKSSFAPTPTPTGGGIQYYLSAQVVNSLGVPVGGDTVIIDYADDSGSVVSQTFTTDDNGRVVLEVTPTTTYTITLSNGYVHKYTASNLQLQSISLVRSYPQYAPNIDYKVWYDSDTETIYMYYEDKSQLTDNVTFRISDMDGNVLWTESVNDHTASAEHSFSTVLRRSVLKLQETQQTTSNLTSPDLGKSYKVDVIGSKTTDTGEVKKVEADFFVATDLNLMNFPIDQTWKNIFFSLLLMVMCGLFGWMGSGRGAVAVAITAAAFWFFGLITIPVFWVWGMILFAFLAVYGYASQQEGS